MPGRLCKDQFHLGPYVRNICAAGSVLVIVQPIISPAVLPWALCRFRQNQRRRRHEIWRRHCIGHIGICWTCTMCTCILLVYHFSTWLMIFAHHATGSEKSASVLQPWRCDCMMQALENSWWWSGPNCQMFLGCIVFLFYSVLTFLRCDLCILFVPILSCLYSFGFQKP